MNNKIQCPICGNTNNIFLDNNSLKLLKLRHPGLLFSNKELAEKFNTRCLCPKCNFEFKYNEVTGYSVDNHRRCGYSRWQNRYRETPEYHALLQSADFPPAGWSPPPRRRRCGGCPRCDGDTGPLANENNFRPGF